MSAPWFRYKPIGYLHYAPRIYWPCSWQGWVVYLGLGAAWLVGGNTISILMFPQNKKAGWSAIVALMAVVTTVFYVVARRTAWRAEKHERAENSH